MEVRPAIERRATVRWLDVRADPAQSTLNVKLLKRELEEGDILHPESSSTTTTTYSTINGSIASSSSLSGSSDTPPSAKAALYASFMDGVGLVGRRIKRMQLSADKYVLWSMAAEITRYDAPDPDDSSPFGTWHLVHDDGDEEDLDHEELNFAMSQPYSVGSTDGLSKKELHKNWGRVDKPGVYGTLMNIKQAVEEHRRKVTTIKLKQVWKPPRLPAYHAAFNLSTLPRELTACM